jgi:hypothetical protein
MIPGAFAANALAIFVTKQAHTPLRVSNACSLRTWAKIGQKPGLSCQFGSFDSNWLKDSMKGRQTIHQTIHQTILQTAWQTAWQFQANQ